MSAMFNNLVDIDEGTVVIARLGYVVGEQDMWVVKLR